MLLTPNFFELQVALLDQMVSQGVKEQFHAAPPGYIERKLQEEIDL